MVYFGDPEETKKPEAGRKRHSRRSSILKATKPAVRNALQDVDVNLPQDDETTCGLGKSRRSKRVSFANTCQVKEFRKEIHVVEQDIIPAPSTQHCENQGHQIAGLDQLLTGRLENASAVSSAGDDSVFGPSQPINSQSFLARFGHNSSQQPLFLSEAQDKRDDMTELMAADMEMTSCVSSSTSTQYSHLSETMQRWEDQSTRVFTDSLYNAGDPAQDNGNMDFTACIGGIATTTQMDRTVNFQYEAEDGGEMELTGCHSATIRQGETLQLKPTDTQQFLQHLSGTSEPKAEHFGDTESKVDSSKFLSKIGMNKPLQLPDFLASDSPIQFQRRASIATSDNREKMMGGQTMSPRHSLGSNLRSNAESDPLAFLQSDDNSKTHDGPPVSQTQNQKVDVHSFLSKLGAGKTSDLPDFLRSPAQEKIDVNSFLNKLGAGEKGKVPAFLLSESPVPQPKVQMNAKKEMDPPRDKQSKLSSSSNEDEGNRTRLFSENDMEFTGCVGDIARSQSIVPEASRSSLASASDDLQEPTQIFKSGDIGEDMELTGTVTLNTQPKNIKNEATAQAIKHSKKQDQSFTPKDLFRSIMDRKSSMQSARDRTQLFSQSSGDMELTMRTTPTENPEDKTTVFSPQDADMEFTTCLDGTKSDRTNKTTNEEVTNYMDTTRNQTKVFGNDDDAMDMTCLNEKNVTAAEIRKPTGAKDCTMDQTRLFSSNDGSMEMTTCLESKKESTVSSKMFSNDAEMDMTCVEEKKTMDKTRVFSTHDGSMEMTCVEEKESVDKTKVFSTHEGDMEITACIDEKKTIDKTIVFSEHHGKMEMTCVEEKESIDKTRVFSAHDGEMEMTACLDKTTVDKTTVFSAHNGGMEITCVEVKESVDKTKVFSVHDGDMEMTSCVEEKETIDKIQSFSSHEGNMEQMPVEENKTCQAKTSVQQNTETTTDLEKKATSPSFSPNKEIATSQSEQPDKRDSLDESCAEMNATTRIKARLAELSQRLNSTSLPSPNDEAVADEKDHADGNTEDKHASEPCKADESCLKRTASFTCEQAEESVHKRRRNTTMSDSMGILDEMSLEFADNISCDEPAFAPECSELQEPQPMNETAMLEPSVHLKQGGENETTAQTEELPPVPACPKSSDDGENVSKYADRSGLQKSMLSLSNRSMLTNSSMMAPKLTNMNSISHISILQGMTEDNEPQTIEDYLEAFDVDIGQSYELNVRQSVFAPRTRKPPEQMGDYLMFGIQDIESSIYDWAVNQMTTIAANNKEKGDEIAQRMLENPPKILKMADDAVSYQKVRNLKKACANLAKKNLKDWRAKMVKSVVEAVKEENECVSQHVQQLQDKVTKLKDMKEKLLQAKSLVLEKKQREQEEKTSSRTQEAEALKQELETVQRDVSLQKESINSWCKERKQPATVEALQQMIVSLKRCCQFEVKKWRSTSAVLSFLGGRIHLIVELGAALNHDFLPDLPAMSITHFSIQSALDGDVCDVDKFVVRHTLGSINAEELAKRCKDTSHLPQVVHELSLACNMAHQLRRDINFKRMWHDITINDTVLDVTFSSLAARCKFHLQLTIEPTDYLKAPLKYKFIPCIGNAKLLEEKVSKVLEALSPAQCHITSIIDAVNYGVLLQQT